MATNSKFAGLAPLLSERSCKCGRIHTDWDALPYVGVQLVPADWDECDCIAGQDADSPVEAHTEACAGKAYALELRNCPCGSTLAARLLDGAS